MIEPFFPPPSLQELHPLERLRVYDSLMMNAQRWRKAHDYHRQRQNIHYQALNQPGIVYGLGVRIIKAPEEVAAQFKTQPWLEIQPGMAIDWEGNPIIVPQAITFPINLPKTSRAEAYSVYLVVSYRDPETLNRQDEGEIISETFRLDLKTSLPAKEAVELCRFYWQPGVSNLEKPLDVFNPQPNQLDLRYRIQAQARCQKLVRLCSISELTELNHNNLSYLINSVASLYPSMQGIPEIGNINFSSQKVADLAIYDVIYLPVVNLEKFPKEDLKNLGAYLKTGGVILIESPHNIEEPKNLKSLVQEQCKTLKLDGQKYWSKLSRDHRLRLEPFLFAALPKIKSKPIEVWQVGGIIWVRGELSKAWGIDEELSLSRHDIRSAQEFGINILHFAWQRRNLSQLLA